MAKTLSNINKSHRNIVDEMGFAVIGDTIEDIEVGDIGQGFADRIQELENLVDEKIANIDFSEIENNIGDVSQLMTVDKDNLVDAINELKAELDGMVAEGITIANNITRNL